MKLGILGQGQLAVMLESSYKKLRPNSPAPTLIPAHLHSQREYLEGFETLIFESEFCDLEALQGLNTFPNLQSMAIFQDKLNQKELFEKARVPQPKFEKINQIEDLSKLDPKKWVLKWARGGYDGKGVWLKELTHEGTKDFILSSLDRGYRVYAESRVSYDQEVALVGCRDQKGNFSFFPLVVSSNFEGVCDVVIGTTKIENLSLQKKAEDIAQKIVLELPDFCGSFAIEFFKCADNLLVNEMAPRVHNSGHISMDAFEFSQFDWHWKAFFKEPLLLKPKVGFDYFGMLNLLPIDPKQTLASKPNLFPSHLGHLHWYNKSEVRHLRKMGHINFGAQTEDEFFNKLTTLKKWREEWQKSL